jgi:hypothetical protein
MTRLGQGPIQLKMPQYFHRKRVPSKGKERVGFDALNKMKQNRVKEKVYCSTIGPRQELLQFIGEKERLECLGVIDYWVGGRLEFIEEEEKEKEVIGRVLHNSIVILPFRENQIRCSYTKKGF